MVRRESFPAITADWRHPRVIEHELRLGNDAWVSDRVPCSIRRCVSIPNSCASPHPGHQRQTLCIPRKDDTGMCIPAIATLILEPMSKSIELIKAPQILFSPTSIVHLSNRRKPLAHPRIETSNSPRSFSFDHAEAFVLVLDSGRDPIHRLHIMLFSPFCRARVLSAMAEWQSWKPNSSKSGAHWYRPSILKRFTSEFEYYLDCKGEPIEIAAQPMNWPESGVSGIFKTQKTRLGTRRTATCLEHTIPVNLSATMGAIQREEGKEALARIKHEKSNTIDEDSGEDIDWIGEGTIQQRIRSLAKVVPSARMLFL